MNVTLRYPGTRNVFGNIDKTSPVVWPLCKYNITGPVPKSRAEGFLCATLWPLLDCKQDFKYVADPPAPKSIAWSDDAPGDL